MSQEPIIDNFDWAKQIGIYSDGEVTFYEGITKEQFETITPSYRVIESTTDENGIVILKKVEILAFSTVRAPAVRSEPNDNIPVVLSKGKQITDPDEAESLGLTVDAQRLRNDNR